MEGVYRVIVEGDLNVHNLCHIAPDETMAFTDIKVKALESLSSAVKQFKDIAREWLDTMIYPATHFGARNTGQSNSHFTS